MQLGRYSVSTLKPPPIHSISFSEDGRFFSVAGEEGYEVWKSWPLALLRRRVLPGTLSTALLLPQSPLLILQGGGNSPLYSPNKAIIFHDKLGIAIAEVEFSERIRGVSARNGYVIIALSRKVVAFEYGIGKNDISHISLTEQQMKGKGKGKRKIIDEPKQEEEVKCGFWLNKLGEWETCQNDLGLMALSTSPGSTLLALPGRQAGHVQLISLPPCRQASSSNSATPSSTSGTTGTSFRSPIILAHTHPLSTLSTTSNGSHIMTTSERGTLIRIWDTSRGRLERELRRGVDKAEMWGGKFEYDGKGRVVAWSDKGTIHVWKDEDNTRVEGSRSSTPTPSTPSLAHLLSRNLPLPKYFSSSPSIAQYHLPRKNPHAISSALGKAGVNVPSMKTDEEGDESERFIVGWVDVQVPISEEENKSTSTTNRDEIRVGKRHSGAHEGSGTGVSTGMGGREERRSFGSDNTSRTATPPLRGGTPTPSSFHNNNNTRRGSVNRNVSSNFINKSSIQDQPKSKSSSSHLHGQGSTRQVSGTTAIPADSKMKVEKQLIAITYSGDWYRLRIPDQNPNSKDENSSENDDSKKGSKCELVEYRRLGVGGGGW
ncbi:uncharacterized protein IL334_006765 [Kwoniella shivajii]|uniref:WD-repeat protein n=1 Tax=Kwoniella shivajii TaxID=564305 RepID=A0ABZ1D6V1_9TREE|nr:hypothetical protein IL334_006765 [Kwoniella shivajii]